MRPKPFSQTEWVLFKSIFSYQPTFSSEITMIYSGTLSDCKAFMELEQSGIIKTKQIFKNGNDMDSTPIGEK